MEKRILTLSLGCLWAFLGSSLGVPLLVIVLCISVVVSASPFGKAPNGPGLGGIPNAGQTQQFAGKRNDAVVNAAKSLVEPLYACGNNLHYKCYTSDFPRNVLQYLDEACGDPNCPYAQSGNFQCVFFVLGAYYMAGQMLPAGPDAVKFWGAYQDVPGWLEVPANGEPRPGDIAVFSGPASGPLANPAGHVAIILDVAKQSLGGTYGYIQLAQANGEHSVENLTLMKTSQHSTWRVIAWPGYELLGYIRNAANG
jgi:CHAP domain